jgi:hypothetical protein
VTSKGLCFTGLLLLTACSGAGARYATGPSCEERQRQLVSVLQSLPDQTLNSPLSVPLPSATLAGAFGKGPVLEVFEARALFDGHEVVGKTQAERVAALRGLIPSTGATNAPLYVAATANVDMRTLQGYLAVLPDAYDPRLAFVRPTAPPEADLESNAVESKSAEDAPGGTAEDTLYSEKLLVERDPSARRQIATMGYQEYSECEVLDAAVAAQSATPEVARWPALKRSMLDAVPRCACSDINPDGLRNLLVAEQRAGNVALGSMPAAFLKDVRCKASMPLRTVQQVLADVENFEVEFSGSWDETGVRFEEVVTNERLLNYLCSAMPGELFESISSEFATVYLKTAKAPQCRAYRLEPVARGAVFGTLRATDLTPSATGSSYHYRLGGNDLRVFGPPASSDSRATDEGPWACNKDLKLSGSDADSISVDGGGRFYFTQSACDAAPPDAQFPGCVFDPTLTPAVLPAVSPAGTPDSVSPVEAAPSASTAPSPATP